MCGSFPGSALASNDVVLCCLKTKKLKVSITLFYFERKPKAERPSPMRRSVRRAFERFLNLAYAPMTTERARISSPGTGTETRDVARHVRR
ncbi:hypothetical protein ERO13_D01G098901v2 [Gossypium hirsutum]|nr:hypothetical protein ERO13_D01G098901v2 [Gossypium hirsutum]